VHPVFEFGGDSHVTPSSLPSDRSTLFLKLGRGDEQAHVLPLDHHAPRFSRALHRGAHLDTPLRLLSLTIDIGPPSPNLLCTAIVAALAYPNHDSNAFVLMDGRDAPPSATAPRRLWTPTRRPLASPASCRPKPCGFGSGFRVHTHGTRTRRPSHDHIGPPSACSVRVPSPFSIRSFSWSTDTAVLVHNPCALRTQEYTLVAIVAVELYNTWMFFGAALRTFGILLGWTSHLVSQGPLRMLLGAHSTPFTRLKDTVSPISTAAVEQALRKRFAQPLMSRTSGAHTLSLTQNWNTSHSLSDMDKPCHRSGAKSTFTARRWSHKSI
jgi:hypothetical protein